METGTFLVSVSLARYFSDERARCLMAVRRTRSARWLARRVRRTFLLAGRVALLCRGQLLPPAEPLALRPGDALEAIPASPYVADLSRKPISNEDAPRARRKRRCASPPAAPPAPPAPPAPHSPADPLQEVKRRALALLAHHETRTQINSDEWSKGNHEMDHEASWEVNHEVHQETRSVAKHEANSDGNRAPRRRRQRRRRRAEPEREPEPEGEHDPEREPEPERESESDAGDTNLRSNQPERDMEMLVLEHSDKGGVLRNECGTQRAPRLVLALPGTTA